MNQSFIVDMGDMSNGNESYRVYATFRDPNAVLMVSDKLSLLAWWKFERDIS